MEAEKQSEASKRVLTLELLMGSRLTVLGGERDTQKLREGGRERGRGGVKTRVCATYVTEILRRGVIHLRPVFGYEGWAGG